MKTSDTSTRQRLIEAAVCRFDRDGFRDVGIDQAFLDVGRHKWVLDETRHAGI